MSIDATQDSNDLSLEQIQALLFDKQRQLTESKLVRVAQAQEQDWPAAPEDAVTDSQTSRPSRSPESWRGAAGHDRFFHATAMMPLDAPLAQVPAGSPEPVSAIAASSATPTTKRYTWRDRLLLIGEIVALAAFLTILGASFRRMRDLNSEYQQAQRARVVEQVSAPTQAVVISLPTDPPDSPTPLPQATRTLSATSTATAAVQIGLPDITITATPLTDPATTLVATLASSATIEPTPSPSAALTGTPIALPGIRPSQSKTPLPLDEMPQETPSPTATIAVTPEPGTALRIEIPSIEVDAPVVEGDTWEPLKLGVGHRISSANPGEIGNVVMSAHNDIYGEIFRQLHKVEPGDTVLVYTATGTFRYDVTSVEIVLPTRVDLMDPTDTPILTLITCYPYLLDTHRVVVRAALAS